MNTANKGEKGRWPGIPRAYLAVLFWLVFLIGLWIMGRTPNQAEINILRQQFHLSEDVNFKWGRLKRNALTEQTPKLEAYVKFSEEEFRAYQQNLNNPDLWQPQPIVYDGLVVNGSYAPDALSWDKEQAGRMMPWGSLSWKQARDASHAKTLCFAMRYPGTNGAAIAPYDAAPCSEHTRKLGPQIIVQGLLDEDNRTLHMLVRGVRPRR